MLRIGALLKWAIWPHVAVTHLFNLLEIEKPPEVNRGAFLVKIIQLELLQLLLPVLQPSASCEQGSESELQRTDAPTLRAVLQSLASIPVYQDRNLLGR